MELMAEYVTAMMALDYNIASIFERLRLPRVARIFVYRMGLE